MASLLDALKYGSSYKFGAPDPTSTKGLLGLSGGVPGAPPMGAGGMPATAPPPPKQSFGSRVKQAGSNLIKDPYRMAMLAKGLQGMSGMENQGFQDAMTMRMQSVGKKREQDAELERIMQQGNKTADAIEATGEANSKETADLIRNDPQNAAKYAAAWQTARMKGPSETFRQVKGPDGTLYNISDTTGKQTAVGGGGSTTTINNRLPPNIAPPEKGYRYVYDDQGNLTNAELIPGSKADTEAQAGVTKARNLKRQQDRAGSTVIDEVNRMQKIVDNLFQSENKYADIVGGYLQKGAEEFGLGRSDTGQAARHIESIASNIGINELMQMKFNSPTGGALGQVPVQQQKILQKLLGDIEMDQRPIVLSNNLKRIKNMYLDAIHMNKADRDSTLGMVNPMTGKVVTQEDLDEIDAQYEEVDFDAEIRGNSYDQGPTDLGDGWRAK